LTHGGCPITRGALYAILTNPLYRGMIRHQGKLYPGQHQAIIDAETWDAAQAIFSEHGGRLSPTASNDLLKSKLFDDAGHAMVGSTGHKGARRYRYYVSAPALRGRSSEAGTLRRVAMRVLDDAVVGLAARLLAPHWKQLAPQHERVSAALHRVEIGMRHLTLDLHSQSLNEIALMTLSGSSEVERLDQLTRVRSSISLARPRNATTLIGAGGAAKPRIDEALVRAITKAKNWVQKLETGEFKSILDLTRTENLCKLHTAKILPLAFLAPDLVEMILDGRQPPRLTLTALIEQPLPEAWSQQRARFADFN